MHFQSETFVFKSLQPSVDGKHLMRFQIETSLFKFLRPSVNRASVKMADTYQYNLFTQQEV